MTGVCVYSMDDGGSVLVRGTLDIHEALREWADVLDDVLYDAWFDCASRDPDDPAWTPPPEQVNQFADHVNDMLTTARAHYWRFRPTSPSEREAYGWTYWLDHGTQGRRGSFPGVEFS